MRAKSNAITFFLLILYEKKQVGATSIFSNLSDRDKFLYKCLISKKQCGFSWRKITIKYWYLLHMGTQKIIHNICIFF